MGNEGLAPLEQSEEPWRMHLRIVHIRNRRGEHMISIHQILSHGMWTPFYPSMNLEKKCNCQRLLMVNWEQIPYQSQQPFLTKAGQALPISGKSHRLSLLQSQSTHKEVPGFVFNQLTEACPIQFKPCKNIFICISTDQLELFHNDPSECIMLTNQDYTLQTNQNCVNFNSSFT